MRVRAEDEGEEMMSIDDFIECQSAPPNGSSLVRIERGNFAAAGTPDIAGFLFEHGTLTHVGEDEEKES